MATYNPSNTGSEAGGEPGAAERAVGKAEEQLRGAEQGAEQAKRGVTRAVGQRLHRAGDYLDEKGRGAFISERLHDAGRFFEDKDTREVARSVDRAVANHPYRGILIGLGVGWLVGRFLSRVRD